MRNVIGFSAYFHDAACCLLQDGVIVAAAQEERFSRRKHDQSLPKRAFKYCLEQAKLSICDIDCLAYYEDPHKKLDRQIWQQWPDLNKSAALRLWRNAKRPMEDIRNNLGFEGPVYIAEHHHSHAASSYFFSGFSEAAVFTVDGVGEWATTTYGSGTGHELKCFEEVRFPDSLGLLYSTMTNYLGFGVNDGEYKVMGLAPYGTPKYSDKIWKLISLAEDGQFRLNLEYFDFGREDRMHSEKLAELFGHTFRKRGAPIEGFHQDLASSLQNVLEEILLAKTRYLHEQVPVDNLCMAGGVALNCVANRRILKQGPFKRLFVQPAAGDAGGAIGAAVLAYMRSRPPKVPSKLNHLYLGPEYSASDVTVLLRAADIPAYHFNGREDDLLSATVDRLTRGKVIGWFQGRMEFGPRALGARSILADPRLDNMRDLINSLVKKREEFRPFAPAVLESRTREHFELDHPSPFMLETCQVNSPLDLPAITHVDGSARVQTVTKETNPRFGRLLECFEQRTGCPILLNTSFNVANEPIVCSPEDAILCFLRSDIDTLVIEDFIIDREQVPETIIGAVRTPFSERPPAINDRIYMLS